MSVIVQGGDLMVFVNGHSIAAATSHSLSLSGETTDISSKDSGSWTNAVITKKSWEASSSNLFTESGFYNLYNLFVLGGTVTLKMSPANGWNGNGLPDGATYWIPSESSEDIIYSGNALITSLNISANNGETATFEVQFTGIGPLSYTHGGTA